MRQTFRIYFLIILGVLACRLPTSGRSNNMTELDSKIDSIFRNLDMTGLGIAVVRADSIIYHKSLGYRILPSSTDKGEALENDDIFRIASISKTFVATAILQLKELGLLTLDDDAQQYLPFPLRNPKYLDTPITIQSLLTHTSSINDSRSWFSIDRINPQVDSLYAECYSPTVPGEKYKYCNLNYTILGAVIEGISRQPFYQYIDTHIMKPIGIKGGFNCNELDSTKFVTQYRYNDILQRYREDKETYRPYKEIYGNSYILGKSLGYTYPPSGMKISTGDLAKYMKMHMNYGKAGEKVIISRESEELMQANYVGKSNYGLSYRQYTDLVPRKVLYGQTGGGNGLKGSMIFEPIDNYGFVILCSGSRSDYIDGYGDIHKPIIKLLYSYLIE